MQIQAADQQHFFDVLKWKSFAKIRLLSNYYAYIKKSINGRQLSLIGQIYQNFIPFSIPALIYQSILPYTQKGDWDQRVKITANKQILIKLQYDCQNDQSTDMIQQHHYSITKDLKDLVNTVFCFIQRPFYIFKSRTEKLNKLCVYINESNQFYLNLEYQYQKYTRQWLIQKENNSIDRYLKSVQESKKYNQQPELKGFLKQQDLNQILQRFNMLLFEKGKQSNEWNKSKYNNKFQIDQNQKFKLINVLELDHQQYLSYSNNFLWKITVARNLCIAAYKKSEEGVVKLEIGKKFIMVDKAGNVQIQKYQAEKENKKDKNKNKIISFQQHFMNKCQKYDQSNKSINILQIAKIMHELFIGQIQVLQSIRQNKDKDIIKEDQKSLPFLQPALGLMQEFKTSKIHECLWNIIMKCFEAKLTKYNDNLPFLDWLIVIFDYLLEIYNQVPR